MWTPDTVAVHHNNKFSNGIQTSAMRGQVLSRIDHAKHACLLPSCILKFRP